MQLRVQARKVKADLPLINGMYEIVILTIPLANGRMVIKKKKTLIP